jgi:hypothetical protein
LSFSNHFFIDTSSITKDGDFVIFKIKDELVGTIPGSKFNYIVSTYKSQCNAINIELIDQVAQLRPDNQIKNIFKSTASVDHTYDPEKPFGQQTKYACDKANESSKKIAVETLSPKPPIDIKRQEDESQKLCKSFGLKKGTKDFVDCMLKIREQDLLKESQQAKDAQEAKLNEQKLADEKNRKELESLRAIQERNAQKSLNEAPPRKDIQADKYQCQKEATQMFPTAFVQSQPNTGNQGINCQAVQNGWLTSMNCQPSMMGMIGYQYRDFANPSGTYDVNEQNRINAFSSCMKSKGWKLQTR